MAPAESGTVVDNGEAPIKAAYIRRVDQCERVTAVASSVASEAAPNEVARKSRKQAKKDQAQTRRDEPNLCKAFCSGTCALGPECRFGHDVETYLKRRPQDLPGKCPHWNQAQCPYGIVCRWASQHLHPDPLTKQYLQAQGGKQAAEVAKREEQSVEGTKGEEQEGKELLSESTCALAPAGPEEFEGLWRGDGTIPSDVLSPLLSPDSPRATLNVLQKEVQTSLWRRTYDFGIAEGVLRSLGLSDTHARRKRDKRARDGEEAAKPAKAGSAQEEAQGEAGDTVNSPETALDANAASASAASASPAPAIPCTLAPSNPPASISATAESIGDCSPRTAPGRDGRRPRLDVRGKRVLAPLTTVGNLPFRRLCVALGAEVTYGEMALATGLLQGQPSEWALAKRHHSERCFGVQICAGFPDAAARAAQVVAERLPAVDFVDLNFGCPIDVICGRGGGAACLSRPAKLAGIVRATAQTTALVGDLPVTLKMRRGYADGSDVVHEILPDLAAAGAAVVTLHGRSREQRYSRRADWGYIARCGEILQEQSSSLQLLGNGDVMGWQDHERALRLPGVASTYVARGALIKPWIFTEMAERRDWDISAGERLDLVRSFCSSGLEHWGADARGVETTRRFLLEWLSFQHRYIPVGLLETLPQRMDWRPRVFVGRSDLETLLASDNAADWVRISEMMLGPAPKDFVFAPKHKAQSYPKRQAAGDAGSAMEETQENG